jgi:hypothetical protein
MKYFKATLFVLSTLSLVLAFGGCSSTSKHPATPPPGLSGGAPSANLPQVPPDVARMQQLLKQNGH